MTANKSFFLTTAEYNSIKGSVDLKNFTRVPNPVRTEGGFWFYSKKK